ncbi:MAG: hypothetical protein ABFD69_04590 [Candidatus Sumerlaeia bacterium]
MNVLPWWPLWLGAAHLYVQNRRGMAIGTLALTLSILGGAHQLAAYGIALLLVYACAQMALDAPNRRKWMQFLITFSFALLISMPGWVPQMDFIRQTSRPGGLDARAILDGSIGSITELLKALGGDWGLIRGGVVDAETADAIGPIAFLLAFFIPRRGSLRRAWIGCWAAALVAIALSLRIVMAPLLDALPISGIFHGPRRWLGAAQWFLILASALSAASLMKYRYQRIVIGFMVAAVLIPAWFTWKTVDLATVSTRDMLSARPPITKAGLRPGERFFSIDYKRDASYDYRRTGLLDWALPNLAMLYGLEDLGGYEPAQTAEYSQFMNALHEPEPWRRPWSNHFGLIVNPSAKEFLDAGNVRAAIMPRFGVPMFFRPVQDQVGLAAGSWKEKRIVALIRGAAGAPARLFAMDGRDQKLIGETSTHRISIADDQIATGSMIAREPAPLSDAIVAADFATANEKAEALAIQVAPGQQFVEGYAWGRAEAALWQPVEIGEVASLMKYRGSPSYAAWRAGSGKIFKQEIRANRVVLDVETTSGTIVIHDAWWRWWTARVDGRPVQIKREGLWRAIDLPAGRHSIIMEYKPFLLSGTAYISGITILCGILFFALLERKRRNLVKRGIYILEHPDEYRKY